MYAQAKVSKLGKLKEVMAGYEDYLGALRCADSQTNVVYDRTTRVATAPLSVRDGVGVGGKFQ